MGEVPEELERKLADPDTASDGEVEWSAIKPNRNAPCLKR
jgi:hypothetical protein